MAWPAFRPHSAKGMIMRYSFMEMVIEECSTTAELETSVVWGLKAAWELCCLAHKAYVPKHKAAVLLVQPLLCLHFCSPSFEFNQHQHEPCLERRAAAFLATFSNIVSAGIMRRSACMHDHPFRCQMRQIVICNRHHACCCPQGRWSIVMPTLI